MHTFAALTTNFALGTLDNCRSSSPSNALLRALALRTLDDDSCVANRPCTKSTSIARQKKSTRGIEQLAREIFIQVWREGEGVGRRGEQREGGRNEAPFPKNRRKPLPQIPLNLFTPIPPVRMLFDPGRALLTFLVLLLAVCSGEQPCSLMRMKSMIPVHIPLPTPAPSLVSMTFSRQSGKFVVVGVDSGRVFLRTMEEDGVLSRSWDMAGFGNISGVVHLQVLPVPSSCVDWVLTDDLHYRDHSLLSPHGVQQVYRS